MSTLLNVLTSLVLVCTPQGDGELDEIFAGYFEQLLDLRPSLATEIGDHSRDHLFENDLTKEFRESEAQLYVRFLQLAQEVDREELTADERLSLNVFVHQLETGQRALDFPAHLVPLDHFTSVAFSFAELRVGNAAHPFGTLRDYENFLKRIDGFEAWCATAVENMALGMERGVVLPKLIAGLSLVKLRAIAGQPAREGSFFGPLKRMPVSIKAKDQERLEGLYLKAIEEQLLPAYGMLASFIEEEYLPACRDSLAWKDMPQGEAWYADRVRFYTTLDLTPTDLFSLGESEVQRVGKLLLAARIRAEDMPLKQYESAQEIAAAYGALLESTQANLAELFDVQPRSELRILPSKQGSFYEPGSPDGSRPGIFRFGYNGGKAGISEALFIHEAIPGHHYQIMLQRESEQPDFRRHYIYSAFIEGWGLYAESLGADLGLFQDPQQQVAQLESELWRALRLVWDVGIHSKGWSLEKCASYGEPYGYGLRMVRGELNRYVAWPGQALSYKAGEQEIIRLRDLAHSELGEDFDLRGFHALVLRTGAVPLDILARRVSAWIEVRR